MARRRTKPWKRVKTPRGIRIKYDYKDNVLGIKRTRATFNSPEEAQDFHDRLIENARKMARGEKPDRVFGEAMVEYLTMESPSKASHVDDLRHAAMLRCPFEYRSKFYRLDDLPLDDSEMGIVVGLELYFKDLRKVERRSYIGNELYQLRKDRGGSVWYHQPHPAEHELPPVRYPVTDPLLIKKLNTAKGRGPYKQDTLRARQALARVILSYVYRRRRWTTINLSDYIERIEPGKARTDALDPEQLYCLLTNSESQYGQPFTRLLKAAAWIGWRRSNLIGLTWDRVFWPREITDPITGRIVHQPGYLIVHAADSENMDPFNLDQRRERTKNREALITTMTNRIESLLRECWADRAPESDVVFHDGKGKHWGDFRRRWNHLKQLTGIPARFRFHDLRHTWASEALAAGINDRTVMDEQGWKDRRMVDRYSHTRLQGRFEQMNRLGQPALPQLSEKDDNNAEDS